MFLLLFNISWILRHCYILHITPTLCIIFINQMNLETVCTWFHSQNHDLMLILNRVKSPGYRYVHTNFRTVKLTWASNSRILAEYNLCYIDAIARCCIYITIFSNWHAYRGVWIFRDNSKKLLSCIFLLALNYLFQ